MIANILICAMLAFSIYCITFAVQSSQTPVEQEGNLFTKNQVRAFLFLISHQPIVLGPIRRIDDYPRISNDIRFNRKDGELSSEKCAQGSLGKVIPKILPTLANGIAASLNV